MSLTIRPARTTDAGKIGAIITEANAAPLWKPRLYSGAQDIAFCGRMIDRGWVQVVESAGGRIIGFIARDGEAIESLFVAGPDRGQGVGVVLLDLAKSKANRLTLWAFQRNTGARKFYEREGFTELTRTDGSRNTEGLPDIHYLWEKPA